MDLSHPDPEGVIEAFQPARRQVDATLGLHGAFQPPFLANRDQLAALNGEGTAPVASRAPTPDG